MDRPPVIDVLSLRRDELAALPHVTELARVDVKFGPRFGWRDALIYRRTDRHEPPAGSQAAQHPERYPHAREPVGLELCIAGPLPTKFRWAKIVLTVGAYDQPWGAYDELRREVCGEWTLTYGAPYGHFDGKPFPGWDRLNYTTWSPMTRCTLDHDCPQRDVPTTIYGDHKRHPVILANYGRLVTVDHARENW